MKYEISVEKYFSAAHALREYKGKCERLHGHNWRVLVVVSGQKLDGVGMVMDFSELKKILEVALSNLDHSFLNEADPFDKINPTAENIAEYILNKIKTDALKYDLNGGHNMSHGDKINNYCKWWEKNTDIFHSGSGGSIIRTDFFRHILTDTIIANHFNIFFKDLRPGPAGIDLLTTFITYVCGGTVGQYSGYCETNWTEYTSRLQTNMIDCLHMFKYYYC